MCGICGIYNFNTDNIESKSLHSMMAAMKHRGPDDEGTFCDGLLGLGFVRLSIIDLTSAGHQPMVSEDGRYVVVFNGEIYNYIELKEELQEKGYIFHTQSDTEVLLATYQEWKEECLHKFNGMWAFVIYDKETKQLFASRDRYGVKPFYYYIDEDQLLFASEIPPILKVLKAKAEPDKQVIFDYLVFNRTDQTESTFFKGIKKLQHGHSLTIVNSLVSIKQWYSLKENLKEPFNSSDEYRELFTSAVDLRLRSDVPVGVCLSGGLDSSAIVSSLLANASNKNLNTFSAVYAQGNAADESKFIHEYDQQLKSMYYITPSKDTLIHDLPDFIKAHAEPMPGTGPYAQFKVMELAKGKVVVTLDGQGADEQLAGYHYFFGFYFKDLLRKGKLLKLIKEIFHYTTIHKSIYGLKTFLYFLLPKRIMTLTRINEKGYLNAQFASRYKDQNSIAGNLYGSNSLHDALLDHFEYKLEHLLKWEDRNSMWFSLESRVPFLDFRLVEKTLSLPSSEIIFKGMTKYYLRAAMKGIVPEKIRLRVDKNGFDTPEEEWFRLIEFQLLINNLLNSELFKSRQIINPEKAKELYKQHVSGKINISKEIWKWINLELWFREFIDQDNNITGINVN